MTDKEFLDQAAISYASARSLSAYSDSREKRAATIAKEAEILAKAMLKERKKRIE